MTRVFIAAPTPALRAGLRAMLATTTIEVAGEAPDLAAGPEGVAGADVVLVGDPELLADAGRFAQGAGQVAMVVLAEDARAVATLRGLPLAGWAIVPPEASPAELQAAVHAAVEGLAAVPLALAGRVFGAPLFATTGGEGEPQPENLTARERQVLELLSQGLSNKLIARALQISEHTVKFHVSSVYTKLGAASRADAVSKGARYGLITL